MAGFLDTVKVGKLLTRSYNGVYVGFFVFVFFFLFIWLKFYGWFNETFFFPLTVQLLLYPEAA